MEKRPTMSLTTRSKNNAHNCYYAESVADILERELDHLILVAIPFAA
jgi:hypothetical protein